MRPATGKTAISSPIPTGWAKRPSTHIMKRGRSPRLTSKRDVYKRQPVRIDPTVTYTYLTMFDTFVTSAYYNNNYGNDANVKIGNSGDLGISRGYYRLTSFPSAIGTNKSITSATLTLYQNYSGASTVDIGVYPLTSTSYDNATITWNKQPNFGALS